jgi:hypothetical protein
MWIVRFLNGPTAGQIVPLSKSSVVIGRSPTCDIKVVSPGVSKEHSRLEIFDDKLILTDAGSRNGTFLNGVQVRSAKAKAGDKIGVHDVIFEIQKVPDHWAGKIQQRQLGLSSHDFGAVFAPPPSVEDVAPAEDPGDLRLPPWASRAQDYVDTVVLPGFYKMPELFEFKWVLAGFMAIFIIMVTALSTVPLVRILKTSIQDESQQHALTIATTLARVNRPFLINGQDMQSSVEIATSRPGVKRAYLISNVDGAIVAPASQAGSFPDLPFVHEARKFSAEAVKQIDDNTVVAMVPVIVFNQDTGQQAVTHWAVVMYDMASLAVDNGKVLSLFITTLFIALILGLALFYILYKLVEKPIRDVNKQLDLALKEGGEQVTVAYLFPALQLLASNVSSALTRLNSGDQGGSAARGGVEHDRNREIGNLVELQPFACMGIRAHDLSIAAVNRAFEERTSLSAASLTAMTVGELGDQALKLSIKDLIERVDQSPDDVASNDLEFSGVAYQIVASAVFGTSKISYYVVVLLPVGE